MKKNRNQRTEQEQHRGQGSLGQGGRARRFTPVRVGIALGVVLLGGTALVSLSDKGRPADAGIAVPAVPAAIPRGLTTSATPAPAQPPIADNPPSPPPGTRMAINATDPFTGKVISASSPTLDYKGYVIGFCCSGSEGWKGGWDRMSEADKDAFVRQCLGN